jgi:hypothetical protein
MTSIQELQDRLTVPDCLQMKTSHNDKGGIRLPSAAWQEAEGQVRRIGVARRRGWLRAALRQERALLSVLRRLRRELLAVEHQLEATQTSGDVLAMREVLVDFWTLHGLEERGL